MPKFSANLGFLWADRPLLDRIDAAAAAGFRAVELHWPYDVPPAEVRAACTRNDLALLMLNTPVGRERGEFGLGALPGHQAAFRDGFARAATYARQAGATAVHVLAGVVPDAEKEAATSIFRDNLVWAVDCAPDLTLLLEALNRTDRPGYFYSEVSEAAALFELVGAPNLGILFDAYHVGTGGGDVVAQLTRFLPLVRHIQVASVPGRAEPDQGELDYGPVFAAIDRLGYRGWVGCEYRPRTATDNGLDWPKAFGATLTRFAQVDCKWRVRVSG